MKILYVEDELSLNTEKILQLFGPTILSNNQKTKLQNLNNDDYGADSNTIRDIITSSGVIDVETGFSAALRRIEHEGNKYNLFIVDRQLATDADAYMVEDVAAIVPEYTVNEFNKYLTREGDYLFMRLLRQGSKAQCLMFYFLTAFTDTIKCQEDLRPFMVAGWFHDRQVLDKGNMDHMQDLCNIIRQSPDLSIRHKYFSCFEKAEALDDSQDTLHRLVKIFKAQDQCKKENRGSVLADARGLLEGMVKRLCAKHDLTYIGRCKDSLKALGPQPPDYEQGAFVISNSCKAVGITAYTLCSDYGAQHANPVVPDDIFYCALYAIRAFITTCQNNDQK